MTSNQQLNQDFSSVYGDIAGRDVVRNTTVQIAHQVIQRQTIVHNYAARRSAPPAQLARNAPPARAAGLTLAQIKLLQLMKPLPRPARIEVLDFLRSQFGTAMIKELEPQALAKAYLYVLKLGVNKTGAGQA